MRKKSWSYIKVSITILDNKNKILWDKSNNIKECIRMSHTLYLKTSESFTVYDPLKYIRY